MTKLSLEENALALITSLSVYLLLVFGEYSVFVTEIFFCFYEEALRLRSG